MIIHQLLSGAGPHDAITAEALAFRSCFRSWGWGGADHAARIVPGMGPAIGSVSHLRPDPDDVLLIHHSAGFPGLDGVLALPNPKLLLYHNVTPPNWLWEHAPVIALHCAIGLEQLPGLVAACDLAAADSEFNAMQLRALGAADPRVVPLMVDLDRLTSAPVAPLGNGDRGQTPPTILFVGRLSPHKRQDDVIRAFALYRRHRSPDARLVLVGDPVTETYARILRELAESTSPGAVEIESGLPEAELGERYRRADAFLCLSEHEGFCIPLLEAFHFRLPVIARPAGAVPETVGDAALLVGERDLGLVAELLHLALSDGTLRSELAGRGQARLAAYAPDVVARQLRDAVEATAAAGRRRGA